MLPAPGHDEGTAVVERIPAVTTDRLAVATAIAYVEGWAHEMTTFGTASQDYSAFSPEDLVSNIVGI